MTSPSTSTPQAPSTKIGFLSFGHWLDIPSSKVRTASDVLLQAIDLAVGAEELGMDGAFFRVHHFAPQHSAPFPLLAAIAARTKRIEIGTGVIDMRYENPLYMAEEAAIADLIAGGRLQLGVSRGTPEPVLAGYRHFGYRPGADDPDGAAMARTSTGIFLDAITGAGIAEPNPHRSREIRPQPVMPQAPGLRERIWWGAGTRATALWTAEQGMNLMSSTLLTEDTGVPLSQLQAEQIRLFRQAWKDAGHSRSPRVCVSRSIIVLVDDHSRRYFGARARSEAVDHVGYIDAGEIARFGRSYIGEVDHLIDELRADEAVQEADTVLVTVPNALGVDFNLRQFEHIARDIRPALG